MLVFFFSSLSLSSAGSCCSSGVCVCALAFSSRSETVLARRVLRALLSPPLRTFFLFKKKKSTGHKINTKIQMC